MVELRTALPPVMLLTIVTGYYLQRLVAELRLHGRLVRRAAKLVALEGEIVAGSRDVVRVEVELERVHSEAAPDDRYREVTRQTSAERFVIQTSAGERIDVVPTAEVLLLAEDTELVEVIGAGATQVARVRHGQRVHLLGTWREEPTVDGEITALRSPPAPKRVLHATHVARAPIAAMYAERRAHYARSLGAMGAVALLVWTIAFVTHQRAAALTFVVSGVWSALFIAVAAATRLRDRTTTPWYWRQRVTLPAPCAKCQAQRAHAC